jgi:methyl-accepting chemotaxis protein
MRKNVKKSKVEVKKKEFIFSKDKFLNLSIHKRLNLTFLYIGFIALIIVLIGVINLKMTQGKLNRFYDGPYKIEENVLKAQVAMKKIENNIFRAYITKKEDLCKKYIQASEEEYDKLEQSINELSKELDSQDEDSIIVANLKVEFEKGNRYRTQILESSNSFDQDKIYSIYKNDYTPILDHILTELDDVEADSFIYGQNYITGTNQAVTVSIITFLLLFIAGAASCIYLLIMIENSITKPITEIKAVMVEISHGNLGVNITFQAKDEMGVLCDAVRETTRKLKDYIKNITDTVRKLEEKDMTVRASVNFEGDFKPIKDSLDNTVIAFQETLNTINESAKEITVGADLIAGSAKTVAEGGSEQADAINRLVKKIDELVAIVNINAADAVSIYELSQSTVTSAQKGNQQMNSLVQAMEAIAIHSGKISNIIHVIEEIAEQTNLLSLNASIEAARAGSAGKGFGVVASEIGKLAGESRKAVQSSTELINSTIHAIREGAFLAKETADNFQMIVNESLRTNQVMDAMAEQSKSQAQQLNESMSYLQQITAIIEGNSAAAQESSAMSEGFISQAGKLEELLGEYKLV